MRYTSTRLFISCVAALGAATLTANVAVAAPSTGNDTVLLAQNDGAGSQNLFALYQQVQRLQEQVRQLNGEVGTLKHQLKLNRQGQEDLYQNLDKRLSALEGGQEGTKGDETLGHTTAGGEADREHDANQQSEDNSDQKTAYMKGFDQLKSNQYDKAITSFKQYVTKYPDGQFTDNAWYWLGESYYVKGDQGSALKAFQKVAERFQSSPKMPGALYKIGLIEANQGNQAQAKKALQQVIDKYPGSDVADLASKKLKSL